MAGMKIPAFAFVLLSALFAVGAETPRTVVGAVNWDCSLPSDTWFGHYATTSLGPAHFRHCTPYYADVKGPDRIDYHWRTVEEYEREMQYAIDAGIDYFAYCWYGELKPEDGKDFTPVEVRRENVCDRHVWELATARRAATGMHLIPTFTLGWNPSPRLEHPVPWCGYGKTRYMRPATEAEWLQGARELADWIRAHRTSCPTGHILSFAWNEFEEGGWICPTWRPDGRPDTSRVEAFRKVGDLWRRTLDGPAAP